MKRCGRGGRRSRAIRGNGSRWISEERDDEAVQINFADEGSTAMGRSHDVYGYVLGMSLDGKSWKAWSIVRR